MVNKRVWNAILGCNLKNDRMISVHFQGKPFNIMVIQVFTTLDLASITSHIYSWVLFLFWLLPFILSGVISPLISSSILGTYWPRVFLFQYPIILLFILFMGFSRQEYWSGLQFPSSVDHILLELSTMTCLSWIALHGMAHSHWVRQCYESCDQFGWFSMIVGLILSTSDR